MISAVPVLAMAGFLAWLYLTSQKSVLKEPEKTTQEKKAPAGEEINHQETSSKQESPYQLTGKKAEIKGKEGVSTETIASPVESLLSPAELSNSPLWQELTGGDFRTRFIVFLDEVSMGFLPVRSLGAYKSKTVFNAFEENDEWFLTPETEARYTPFVELFSSIDPKLAGKVYRGLKPTLQTTMTALGYADRTPDQMLASALETLRQIPLYESNPPMNKVADGIYTWKYKELEALSPIQKCVLRMGQANLRKIREKAEQFAVELF